MSSQYNYLFGNDADSQTSSPMAIQNDHNYLFAEDKPTWVKSESPNVKEQLKTSPGIFARESVASLYALPSITAESYRFLADKLRSLGEEQAIKEGRELSESEKKFTENVVNYIPDLIKSFGEKFPNIFPTFEQAREKIGKRVEKHTGQKLPKEARGGLEKFATGSGRAFPIAVFPGSLPVKAAGILTSGATEASNLSEKGKIAGNLTIPALTSIIESIARRKYTPPKGQAEQLYKEGKRLGMTDTQLAPILATEGQIERHGPLATGLNRTARAFEETGEVLGDVIQDIQNRPANANPIPVQIESQLLNDLGDMATNLRQRTHAPSPQEAAALKFIDDVVTDISNKGATNKSLIGTWRSINKSGANKRDIQAIKRPLLKAIEASDPLLAADLKASNALYARFMDNVKRLNPSQFNAFIDAGELQQLLAAVFTGNVASVGKQVLNIASLNTLRRISSAMLTDPMAQSLLRNFGKAVRDGKGTSARALGNQFKEYVQKNLPEEYKEIDWKDLGI